VGLSFLHAKISSRAPSVQTAEGLRDAVHAISRHLSFRTVSNCEPHETGSLALVAGYAVTDSHFCSPTWSVYLFFDVST
jgi:hypothetical protein